MFGYRVIHKRLGIAGVIHADFVTGFYADFVTLPQKKHADFVTPGTLNPREHLGFPYPPCISLYLYLLPCS